MSAGVGADVEALCSKCGDVWHVVVAKVGERIVKVQCKQCSGYHRYKSPHGAPAEKKLPSATRPAKEPRASRDPVERFEKPRGRCRSLEALAHVSCERALRRRGAHRSSGASGKA
ncbi:MAG: hypothetical protein IPQ07_16970 [Myxococcales bacterium]|nr:hypothetical protein [Myxococcales bacterium]